MREEIVVLKNISREYQSKIELHTYKYIEKNAEKLLERLKEIDFSGKSIEKVSKEFGLNSVDFLTFLGLLFRAGAIKDIKIV